MIGQYRGILTALLQINVSSAQLPNPVALENVIRDRSAGDFPQLTNAFGQTYRAIPQARMPTPWSAISPTSMTHWRWRT